MLTNKIPRRENRQKRRIRASLEVAGKSMACFLTDFSNYGCFLITTHLFKPNTLLSLRIQDPGGDIVLQAKVISLRDIPPMITETKPTGIGIEFISTSPEYSRLLSSFSKVAN